MVNRKDQEPQCVISAPAQGGNLISAPRLPLHNTVHKKTRLTSECGDDLMCKEWWLLCWKEEEEEEGWKSFWYRYVSTVPRSVEMTWCARNDDCCAGRRRRRGGRASGCGWAPGWPAPPRCSPHSQTSSRRSAPSHTKATELGEGKTKSSSST